MDQELKNLRIDRTREFEPAGSKWARRWIVIGILVFVLAGAAATAHKFLNSAMEVSTVRAQSQQLAGATPGTEVVLNATGYIVAAHKIQVASKVVGKVAWIGVDKGDRVKEGQVIVRLEDDEYRAHLQQASGQLTNLEARLKELENGSRPEEIAAGGGQSRTSQGRSGECPNPA